MSHNLRRKQLQDFTEMVAEEQAGYVGVPVDIDYYAATAKEYDTEFEKSQRTNPRESRVC